MAEDVVANIGDGLKQLYRSARNVASGASDTEIKVRDATNNDKWGPTGQQMKEIAQLTHSPEQFNIVMNTIWKRLNDNGKYWRHVYKALLLLDYLIKNGSEQVVRASLANTHQIRTLRQFQYVTELGKDEGQNVRQRAKLLVELLSDKERLREERKKARENSKKFTEAISSDGWGNTGRDSFSGNSSRRSPSRYGGDDDDWGPPDRGRDRERDRERDRGRRSYSRSPSPSYGRRSPSPDRRDRDRDRDRSDRRRDDRDRNRDRDRDRRRSNSPRREASSGGGGRPRAPSGGDAQPPQQQQQPPQQSATSLLFDLGPTTTTTTTAPQQTQYGSPQQQQQFDPRGFQQQQQQQPPQQQPQLGSPGGFGSFGGQQQQQQPSFQQQQQPPVQQQQQQPAFDASFNFNPRAGQAPLSSGGSVMQPQPQQQQQMQQQQSASDFASFTSFQGVGQPQARPGDIVSSNQHLYNLDTLSAPPLGSSPAQQPKKTLAELQQANHQQKQPVLQSAPRISTGSTMPVQSAQYGMPQMQMQMQQMQMQQPQMQMQQPQMQMQQPVGYGGAQGGYPQQQQQMGGYGQPQQQRW